MATNVAMQSEQQDKEKRKRAAITDSFLAQMLWRFLRPYKWQMVGVFILLSAVSALTLLPAYLIQQAIDGPIADKNIEGLTPIGIVFIGAIIATFILQFAYTYWLQYIGQSALLQLRQEFFEHVIRQDMTYFNHTPVGKIVSRMSNDVESLSELLSTSIVMVARNLVTLIGIIIVMVLLNWRMALLSLAVIPFMMAMSLYFRTKIRRIADQFHKIMAEYLAFLNEHFNGMLIVQLFGRQRRTMDDFERVNKDYFVAHMDIRDAYTYYASALRIMTTAGLAFVLYGGGSGVLAEWATLGMLIAFIEYTRLSFEPILGLSEQFAQIQSAFSAGERIAKMLATESSIKEPEHPAKLKTYEQRVTFENVVFGYDDAHPVLRGVDLTIEPGTRVAIVGATGAGKTTFVKLLARYYDVSQGRITVSGADIRDLSMVDLRRLVSVVPQNPYVFNGTIADNLRLFDTSITMKQMQAAAETACAAPFINELPGGYDFELLPGGGNLSHGQRQLLALARALIHSPESILVLDEATSNIDTETEVLIQAGLEKILDGRTSLIIAHRLSTIRDADRILVMKEGKLIEDGNHDELLALDGLYAQLYHRQFEDEITLSV
ncbi:MAG: ABC transporter ATP-binding protein [Aggregatilineales bacterium]